MIARRSGVDTPDEQGPVEFPITITHQVPDLVEREPTGARAGRARRDEGHCPTVASRTDLSASVRHDGVVRFPGRGARREGITMTNPTSRKPTTRKPTTRLV